MICPVEVKAGKSGSRKSILQFTLDKKTQTAVRFDLNLPSIQNISHKISQNQKSENIAVKLLSLPLYMIGQLNRLIDMIRKSGENAI